VERLLGRPLSSLQMADGSNNDYDPYPDSGAAANAGDGIARGDARDIRGEVPETMEPESDEEAERQGAAPTASQAARHLSVKSLDGSMVVIELSDSASETVADIKGKVAQTGIATLPEIRLVHKGRVLMDEDTAAAAGLWDIPVVILAKASISQRPTPPQAARRPSNDMSGGPAGPGLHRSVSAASLEDVDEERTCRVCFETSGRMFSPCLCRGSMRYVHLHCLNEWRTMSANSRSYYQCDQCGYRYNLMRTEWAKLLESPTTVAVATAVAFALLLGVASTTFGVGAELLQWNPYCVHFYMMIDWSPYSDHYLSTWWLHWMDAIIGGALLMGLTGLLISAYERIQNEEFDYRGLLLTVLANDERILRVFVVLGVSYSFSIIHHKVQEFFKRCLTSFGEQILDVQGGDAAEN